MTNRKRYSIILAVLAAVALFTWYGGNAYAARQLRLMDHVQIGDLDAVHYILRWDRKQVNRNGEVSWAERGEVSLLCDWFGPLRLAVRQGHQGIVLVLLAAGAAVDDLSGDAKTVLYYAAVNGQAEVVKALLAAGAQPNRRDAAGDTILMAAARSGHVEAVKLLLSAGAEVNAKGGYQWTALHRAASENHAAVVSLLLGAGADLGSMEENGMTALHWAASNSHVETIAVLLAAGADVNHRGLMAITPLDCATDKTQDPLGIDDCGSEDLDEDDVFVVEPDQKERDAKAARALEHAKTSRRVEETRKLLRDYGGKTSKELAAGEKQ